MKKRYCIDPKDYEPVKKPKEGIALIENFESSLDKIRIYSAGIRMESIPEKIDGFHAVKLNTITGKIDHLDDIPTGIYFGFSEDMGELHLLGLLHMRYKRMKSSIQECYLNENAVMPLPNWIVANPSYKCIEYFRKLWLQQIAWSEQNHHFYPEKVRDAIFTTLVAASRQNGIPNHLEAQLYKLPKEILYYIFSFICKNYENVEKK